MVGCGVILKARVFIESVYYQKIILKEYPKGITFDSSKTLASIVFTRIYNGSSGVYLCLHSGEKFANECPEAQDTLSFNGRPLHCQN